MRRPWIVTGDEDYEGPFDPFTTTDARQEKTKKEA